ncbi:DUF969 domain-containing protein [Vibrio sp. WJH972]
MIDLWPLIGVVIITIGFAFRLNTLLVILVAGFATGFVAKLDVIEILSILGSSFTKNRYMSLFILVLPMIGLLESYGLRERAEILISSMRKATVTKVTLSYLLLRKITVAIGLNLGGHPSMIRPLVAPMAESAATQDNKNLSESKRMRIRALSAISENFGNFFSQLIFIGSGGLLLIKGVLSDSGYPLEINEMYFWAIPTAIASIIVFSVFAHLEVKRIQKAETKSEDK